MANFFENINQNFFNVFTGRNRELNYELLSLINENIGQTIHNYASREELIDIISLYIKEHPQLRIYDDEKDEESNETDVRKLSSLKVSYFVKTGWLYEEEDTNFKSRYMVDENAIQILKAMANITKARTNQNELYGYVYQIYNSIKTFNINECVGITERIVDSSETLVNMLRGVNIVIKKYLQSLLQNKDLKPNDILEKLLVDYNDKVVLKSLQNLRERDNPDKYKFFISDNLDRIYTTSNNELIEHYIKDKLNGEFNDANKAIANEFFLTSFKKVKDVFNNINEIIRIININNAKYVSSARNRTNFLINDNINLEGLINDTLKNIKEYYDLIKDDELIDEFNMYSLGSISEDSLYTPRNKIVHEATIKIEPIEEISEEEIEDIKNNFFKDNLYSAYKINEYVLSSMGDKKKIEAKDLISTNKNDDTIKQFLVLLYSENKNIDYKVDFDTKLDSFIRYGIEFSNFIIERI